MLDGEPRPRPPATPGASYYRDDAQTPARLIALSDGIFAFAMTLLVLGVLPPAGFDIGQLGAYFNGSIPKGPSLRTTIFAYLLGFFVTGTFWIAHDRMFALIHRYDPVLLRLNLLTLAFVALVPFSTIVLADASTAPLGAVTYAVMQAATGTSLLATWWYASGPGRLTSPSLPAPVRRYILTLNAFAPAIFVLSIPICFWDPMVGEFSWAALFVLTTLRFARIRRTLFPPLGPADPDRAVTAVDDSKI